MVQWKDKILKVFLKKEGFNMPDNPARRLTQGAMMVALFVIILAISAFVPSVYIVTIWVLPLPIAWYSAKYSTGPSITVTIAALILSFIISGGLAAMPAALIFSVIGLVMGTTIRLKKSKAYMFVAASLASFITVSVSYKAAVQIMNIDVLQLGLDFAHNSINTSRKMLNQMELSAAQMKQLVARLDYVDKTVDAILPTVVVMSIIAIVFIALLVCLPILRKLGVQAPKFNAFRHMKLPRSLLWYYLAVLIIQMFVKPAEGTYLYVAVLNLSLLLVMLLALQGYSLLHFFLYEKNMPKGVVWIVTIVTLPLAQFMPLIGLVDVGFDVRTFIQRKTKNRS